jgi:hypothetical protein
LIGVRAAVGVESPRELVHRDWRVSVLAEHGLGSRIMLGPVASGEEPRACVHTLREAVVTIVVPDILDIVGVVKP